MQYLLFYAEIIDKNRKNRAYADLGHISGLASEAEEPAPMLRGQPWGQGRPFRCPEDADLKTRMEMREALMSGHGMCIAYLPQDWSICDTIRS